MSEQAYTYQGGRKVPLSRLTTHFISRALEQDLRSDNFEPLDSLTPNAWIVRTDSSSIDDDIRRARTHAPAYPAYVVADDGASFLLTDRIFVRFRHASDATESAVHRFAQRHGFEIVERFSDRDLLFRVAAHLDVIDVIRDLTERESDLVEIADHDLYIEPEQTELVPDEPFGAMQWYLHSSAPEEGMISACALVDCQGAWAHSGYGSSEIVISIVDSGCNLSDPNFGEGKFVGWGVIIDGKLESGADVEAKMDSPRPHGTLCATLAAASRNHVGGIGAAPNCKLLPVKWQEIAGGWTFSHSLFSRIIQFLSDKVDVVSCSWSLGRKGYWPPAIVDQLRRAAMTGGPRGNGMVWVWSAGNQNCPIHLFTEIPIPTVIRKDGTRIIARTSYRFENSFAGVPGTLHVGAISSIGQRCHYSNYGPGLDVVAPSDNRHLYGRLPVVGARVLAPRNQGLAPLGGTSAAAPLVAGVAALVRSANPNLSGPEVASILRRTADKNLHMGGYPRCGRHNDEPGPDWDVSPVPPFDTGHFGPIGHPDGLWSAWFGFGKVNARRAVIEARRSAI